METTDRIYEQVKTLPEPLRREVLDFVMISTQLQQAFQGFDELIDEDEDDFHTSGLKVASVIRLGRLAVVSADVLVGAVGEIVPSVCKGYGKSSRTGCGEPDCSSCLHSQFYC